MFEQLHLLDGEQAEIVALSLARGQDVAILVDRPRRVYIMFSASDKEPYSVDFVAVRRRRGRRVRNARHRGAPSYLPCPLTPIQGAALLVWTEPAVKAICTAWRLLAHGSMNE